MRPFFSMLTVHAIPVGLYGAKLRILLRHKALAWHEEPPLGGYGSDAYKSIVFSENLAELSGCRPKPAQWLPREAA